MIEISGDLNKTYDRNPAIDPQITKTGSSGEVVLKWYQGGKELDKVLVNAGKQIWIVIEIIIIVNLIK